MRQRHLQRGFTIVEVLVAIVVLTVGVLGLVGTSALVTRTIGQGKRNTHASLVAANRLETLRLQALAALPRCVGLTGGAATAAGNVLERWTITGSGPTRWASVVVTYPAHRGTSADTIFTVIHCG